VPQESATIGLPGDIENIVRLAADHSNMCRFDTTDPASSDKDIYKHVEGNMRRLYKIAVAKRAHTQQDASIRAIGGPASRNPPETGLY
jgi:hypothetical protein